MLTHLVALFLLASASGSKLQQHYDVVILGTGLKESLLAGLLASHGKLVLQLEQSGKLGGSARSLDLQQLAEATEGVGAKLSEKSVGKASDYRIERTPKMFLASGTQLQMLVASGAWQHMNPPGFKRVHRSLLYRRRPDGNPDVHRVLANSEDVVKTRMLAPLEKARMLQFFAWVEKYDEGDDRTHQIGTLSKRSLDLHKMNAAKFLAFWELPEEAVQIVTRGMALYSGAMKRLKRMPAIELVRRVKRYKDAYRTFPHMTSPYVYPVGGFGSSLATAMSHVLETNGGTCLLERPVDEILQEDGSACGVVSDGVPVHADCVVTSPEYVPDRVGETYQVVRLFAVLTHPPNLCKDSSSCQLLMPAAQCGRVHDINLVAFGPTHGAAPKGKWVVVASARVEGSMDDGLDALAVAKRELAAVLPILKPSRRMFAEVVPYLEPQPDAQLDNLHVLRSCDESSHFDTVERDVEAVFERITGEKVASLRRP